MSYLTVLSTLGTILGLFCSIAPLLSIIERAKTKHLEQIPITFLKVGHLCQAIWLMYGFKLNSMDLIIGNVLTTIISSGGLFAYAFYSNTLYSFLPVYVGSWIFVVSFALFYVSVDFLGSLCVVFSLITTFSSLESLFKAINYRNHRYIDLKMNIPGLFCGLCWTLFGIGVNDKNIAGSSGFGTSVTLALILTHLYYKQFEKKN